MPRSAADPNCWTTSLRKDLRSMNGAGWRVREKGGKVQVTRADEDGRSSVMLDVPWHPNSKIKILAAVEQLHKRMVQLGCSLRHAHDLANNGGQITTGKLDWHAVRDQFLETVADRRINTRKDIAFRAQRTLDAMASKPRPKDGTEVLQRYADLFLSDLDPGSSGRKRNIDDAARFLRFGVERCGANAKWMPPTGERRREIIGAADAFHDEAKLTQPVTPEQFAALLDALEEEGLMEIRLAAGLVGCFGLRPAELAVLEYRDGRLFVGKIKRNPRDFAKTARQQQVGGERMVGPLDPPGHEGLGMALAAQWASGLVKLPRAIQTQINNGNLKATGSQFYRHLQRCSYWQSLVAANPDISPYSLRHGWAFHAHKHLERSLDASVASRFMGHSEAIHTRTYSRWCSQATLIDCLNRSVGREVMASVPAETGVPAEKG